MASKTVPNSVKTRVKRKKKDKVKCDKEVPAVQSEKVIVTQISPAKYWSMTLNNYTDDELKLVKYVCSSIKKIYRYVIGFEIGELNKTPHLQGFVSFYDKVRPKEIFMIPRIHWEKTYSNEKSNLEYCIKCDDIFITNYVIPDKVNSLMRCNLYEWQLYYLNIVEGPIHPRDIHWIYGKQNVGKSQFQKYLVLNNDAIILDGTSRDMKNGIIQYMKCNENRIPKLIVSNIPYDVDIDTISYRGYEDIKDMCFFSGKYEGGMVCGNPPHILLFSNKKCSTKNVKFVCKGVALTKYETVCNLENENEIKDDSDDDLNNVMMSDSDSSCNYNNNYVLDISDR